MKTLAATALLLLASISMHASVRAGIPFAQVNGHELKLDLHMPDSGAPVGTIVWVHGGAWRAGSRESADLKGLTAFGWAVASVDYRLSTQARFPAQIHDIKAAIRFLRAHASDYQLPADRFVVGGSSAGGHLAALVGVANGVSELEGTVGENRSASSAIQAIVDLYGASNLTTILSQSSPHGLSVRVPALDLLLGGQPDKVPELARLASPVFHVEANDPPLFLLHGEKDNQMPPAQSVELADLYRKQGLTLHYEVVPGAGHGGPAFTTPEKLREIDRFLRDALKI